MTKKLKKQLIKIIAAGVLFVLGLLPCFAETMRLVMLAAAYLIVGGEILRKAVRNIFKGRMFDENLLMTIATLAAFAICQYPEAAAVMLFFQIGEFFQSYAVNRSRKSISALMDIRPEAANVLRDGKIITVRPEEVAVGEMIVIRPGEKVPLDAVVEKGATSLNTAALTGESLPRDVQAGDAIASGCVNLNGTIEARVTSLYQNSTAAKILQLTEYAATQKAGAENLITRFARWYTPTVVILALLLAVIPPLVGWFDWNEAVYRAITFLVISCPCALVISVPLSFFGGIGAASRCGILVKGGRCLEALAKLRQVIFDKTGTLSYGKFAVHDICPTGSITKDELLELAAHAEAHSPHPLAAAIRSCYGKKLKLEWLGKAEELPGFGVRAEIDGREVYIGSEKLMKRLKLDVQTPQNCAAAVLVAVDGQYMGYLTAADEPRPEVPQALAELRKLGAQSLIMLTGDSAAAAEPLAKFAGLDTFFAGLLPADKVGLIEKHMMKDGSTLFVGDGINDAPALARADVGVAMGGIGSDAALEAADVVIMNDRLDKIAQAVRLARRTVRIARQNIVFALGVKLLVLALGALGDASIWAAVFADVGVTVLAVLNAMRV